MREYLGRLIADRYLESTGWIIDSGDLYIDYDARPGHIPTITIDGLVIHQPGSQARSVRLILSKGRIKFCHLASSERSGTPRPRGRTCFVNEQEVLVAIGRQVKQWYAKSEGM